MNHQIFRFFILSAIVLLIFPAISLGDTKDIVDAEIETHAKVDLGYRGFSLNGKPGRAAEYRSLKSSPTAGIDFFKSYEKFNLDLDGYYLSEDEFLFNAGLNSKGQIRLDLRSQRMFHNLDHIPYDNGQAGDFENRVTSTPVAGSRPDSTAVPTRHYYTDHNTNDEYGLRLDMNEAKVRLKAPSYPAHFNLAYWRYEKKGEKQLRFLNHRGTNPPSGNTCTGCHIQSKTRDIDRVTEEIKASIDAHTGYVDVVLETLYRTFRDREETPLDGFRLNSGWQDSLPHDEDPDSRLTETTLKINTAPSGGLVGSASLSLGKRENESDLQTEAPIKAETDYLKATADVNYTRTEKWTFNLRYRHLDMDSDNTQVLTTYGGQAISPGLPVKEAIDIRRDWYEATINYRPAKALTLKAEFRIEDIERNSADSDFWEIPENEVQTRAKIGFQSRFLERSALKLNGWMAFEHSDDPAYGTSAEDSMEYFLSANYAPKGVWGLSGSVHFLDEENDGRKVERAVTVPGPGSIIVRYDDYDLARERQQQNASLGGWVIPIEGVTLDLNYGFFRTSIDQDLLFGSQISSSIPQGDPNFTLEDEGVDLSQTIHTVRAGISWLAKEKFNCRLEGYHIRSKERFSPEFSQANPLMTSGGLRDINKVDIVQNGVRGRVDWQLDDNWGCGIEAAFDDYDERGNDLFDGSVVTTMVSLSRSW